MILDAQTLFSDNQALAGTSTVVSTNALDMGTPGTMALNGVAAARDMGKGNAGKLQVQVTATATGGTSVVVEFIQSASSDLSSPDVLAATPAIPLASLVAGYVFPLGHIPLGATKRYLGLRYTRVGTFTAGTVTAGVVLDRQTY